MQQEDQNGTMTTDTCTSLCVAEPFFSTEHVSSITAPKELEFMFGKMTVFHLKPSTANLD